MFVIAAAAHRCTEVTQVCATPTGSDSLRVLHLLLFAFSEVLFSFVCGDVILFGWVFPSETQYRLGL